MTFTVPKLKYNYDALEPYLSQDSVHFHYGKHTKKYFDTTNELIKGTIYEKEKSLDDLLPKLKKGTKLYNQAMQAWNHQFFWNCLAPETEKPGEFIAKQFKTVDAFIEEFTEKSTNHFSNGWCWLTIKDKELKIVTTSNADQPADKPLLVIDFWEHAYLYNLQYAANRPKYIKNIWSIVNWNFVNENYKNATA